MLHIRHHKRQWWPSGTSLADMNMIPADFPFPIAVRPNILP
jgi:hypothetical protein